MCTVALVACGGGEPHSAVTDPRAEQATLAGSPPPLARIHAQANDLLDGGPKAYDRRIEQLAGYPIVVNKWASWCGPCRSEFPYFQTLSTRYGKRIAFLGIDAGDSAANANDFLIRFPLSYPSYTDPHEEIARSVGVPAAFPVTLFYDSHGKIVYRHQGAYASESKLDEDIRRYTTGA